jgi:hypothetical protein
MHMLLWPILAMTLTADGDLFKDYQNILEQKYEAPLVSLQVVSAGPTTKVLWFDWEKHWWGEMNIIETKPDGSPLFWYDIPDPPTAQSIESIKIIDLSGKKYIEVIDCSHMGNGMLSLYQLRRGRAELKLRARVIANLSVEFEPYIATIQYEDLNDDGETDVVLDAKTVAKEPRDALEEKESTYHREFVFSMGKFIERKDRRRGLRDLMD